MPVDDLPTDIQPLVHKSSSEIWPLWNQAQTLKLNWLKAAGLRKRYSALRSDIGAVLVKIAELKRSRNGAVLAEWKTRRLEELEAQKKVR